MRLLRSFDGKGSGPGHPGRTTWTRTLCGGAMASCSSPRLRITEQNDREDRNRMITKIGAAITRRERPAVLG
jgi:hypothetical protein